MAHNATPGVEIRPYLAADRQACLQIFRSNLPRYFDASELPEFEEFLARSTQDYFVAQRGAAVLACGGCYARDGVGYLSWGMVARAHHHATIGTALLVWRVDRLFSQPDISEIRIDTSQHTAGFFARHGFRTTRQLAHGFGTGIDQVSMSLLRADWRRAG
ncbi:MAG TPA: GNAT family N-acetyltransferase [Pseudorhodoferax sp.]|jgi:N-acetylglutamate synthase-like GNAT family acetyltransferase|nr:GNAT family N-acetyltransferase [Pseudorhodoferax sp.]